jgi:hypothetical protein
MHAQDCFGGTELGGKKAASASAARRTHKRAPAIFFSTRSTAPLQPLHAISTLSLTCVLCVSLLFVLVLEQRTPDSSPAKLFWQELP